jgi:HPt (histidine-containing phosphotransfer) domain-containing protein
MGRVVREDRLAVQFNEQLNQGLVRSAAARASGLEYEEFETRLQVRWLAGGCRRSAPRLTLCFPAVQRLLYLMPFLQPRLLRIQPKLLAALAADPDLIAARLIELKALLPAADVAAVAGQRPSLLLAGEWERVPDAVRQLLALYSEEEAARLATAEPVLLADDVEEVLAELGRWAGQARALALQAVQPSCCGMPCCQCCKLSASGAGCCRSRMLGQRCCSSPRWPATSAA